MPVTWPANGTNPWSQPLRDYVDAADASNAFVIGVLGGNRAYNLNRVDTAVDYTAVSSDLVVVDTTGGDVTVTLPNSPADKTRVGVKHGTRGGTNTAYFARSGTARLESPGGPLFGLLSYQGQVTVLEYDAGLDVWLSTSTVPPILLTGRRSLVGQSPTAASGTARVMNFDTVDYDSGLFTNPDATHTRFTCPAGYAGFWQFGAGLSWPEDGTTQSRRFISLRLNGTTTFAAQACPSIATAGVGTPQAVSARYRVAAGDYVEVFVRQDGTGTFTIVGDASSFFEASFIRPI